MNPFQEKPLICDLKDVILVAKQDRYAVVQKLVHQEPDNVWLVAILSHVLTNSHPTLAQAYKSLTGRTGTVFNMFGMQWV